MQMLLLISKADGGFYLAIVGAILAIGLSVIAWAMRTAECYEHEEDPVYVPEDMELVTPSDILAIESVEPCMCN